METSEKEKISFKPGHRSRACFLILDYLFLCGLMILMIIPLFKIVVDSLDPTTYGIRLWPKVIDFAAYEQIIKNSTLYRPFLVSVFTTIAGTAFGLLITTLAAFVIIQKEMPGRKILVGYIFFTMLFSGGLIPAYLNIKNLGLMNNLIAVIIPCSLSAYNIILMKSFFETIPASLYEAAAIDGCSPMRTFWKIVLPLSKPALASIGLFIAVGLWNEYMHFILYMTDSNWKNFQVKVRDLILNDGISGTSVTISQDMLKSAVVIVVILPFLIIYPFLQKYFVKGVTIGSVKG